MSELQRATHKFYREVQHLSNQLDTADSYPPDGEPTAETIDLVLAQSKRVRASSTFLVRALARHRDQLLQPDKEGTSE